MEYPLNQSIWRRGWNDTKTVWTSWQFYILDVVVGAVIGSVLQWYWGLGIVLFGMVCAWLAITISAPIRQRNEARNLLLTIPSKHKSIADKLAEYYFAGDTLKTAIFNKPNDGEGALGLHKEWFTMVKDFFYANPNELGESKLFSMIPDNNDLTIPISDKWNLDEKTTYVYIMLSVQLSKLKKIVEEFLR